MEHAEELFYHAFCAVIFCLAASLFFLLLQRYSDTMEGGRERVAGDTSYQSERDAAEDNIVTGSEILLLFYEELTEETEIDGNLYQKGGMYDVEERISLTGRYEKQVFYENGVISRIIYRRM